MVIFVTQQICITKLYQLCEGFIKKPYKHCWARNLPDAIEGWLDKKYINNAIRSLF